MLTQIKKNNKEKPAQGFTIIEVMIVLAIAGLILLIVFLAVPALQRSARNTQRKNDAAAVAAAVGNFISDNGGSLPVGVANDSSANTIDVCAGGGASQAGATACTGNVETAKLGYYAQSGVWLNKGGAATVTAVAPGSESTTAVSTNSVLIDIGYSCNSSNTGVGTANSRSAAILYATETGSGNGDLQCVEQ